MYNQDNTSYSLTIEPKRPMTSMAIKKQEKFEKATKNFVSQVFYENGFINEASYYSFEVLEEFYGVLENSISLASSKKGNNWSERVENKAPIHDELNRYYDLMDSDMEYHNERREGIMAQEERKFQNGLKFFESSREKVYAKNKDHLKLEGDSGNALTMNEVRILLNTRIASEGISLSKLVAEDRDEARA